MTPTKFESKIARYVGQGYAKSSVNVSKNGKSYQRVVLSKKMVGFKEHASFWLSKTWILLLTCFLALSESDFRNSLKNGLKGRNIVVLKSQKHSDTRPFPLQPIIQKPLSKIESEHISNLLQTLKKLPNFKESLVKLNELHSQARIEVFKDEPPLINCKSVLRNNQKSLSFSRSFLEQFAIEKDRADLLVKENSELTRVLNRIAQDIDLVLKDSDTQNNPNDVLPSSSEVVYEIDVEAPQSLKEKSTEKTLLNKLYLESDAEEKKVLDELKELTKSKTIIIKIIDEEPRYLGVDEALAEKEILKKGAHHFKVTHRGEAKNYLGISLALLEILNSNLNLKADSDQLMSEIKNAIKDSKPAVSNAIETKPVVVAPFILTDFSPNMLKEIAKEFLETLYMDAQEEDRRALESFRKLIHSSEKDEIVLAIKSQDELDQISNQGTKFFYHTVTSDGLDVKHFDISADFLKNFSEGGNKIDPADVKIFMREVATAINLDPNDLR